jgi:NADPH-dependent 2,4-dienoyl-CoA reductase/sulfur reductase-like enzyme
MSTRRYLIIGSGAAGIGAVEGIRSLDPSGDIVLLCEEKEGYYSRPGLAYYLADELPEKMLFPFTENDFRRLNVRRELGRAVSLRLPEQQVELQDGRRIPFDQLLLATGASATRAQVPGIQADGVVKLDTLADAQNILRQARWGGTAVVVGGGITALEIVEGLRARRMKVHYFLRGDRYWSNILDQEESRLVEHRLEEDGVRIHYHTELAEVLQKNGRLTGVRTRSNEVVKCNLLAIAIGVAPRAELATSAGLKVDRGILVNEWMQTDAPGVFAAGDVAQVFDPLTGKYVLDTLWGPARQQGTIAGKNMAALASGQPLAVYRKGVAFNVTRLAGLTTTIIGAIGGGRDEDLQGAEIVRGDSEVWRQRNDLISGMPDTIAAQSGFDVNRLRLVVGEKTLFGAVLIGDQTLSIPLQRLVADRVDISDIHTSLLGAGSRQDSSHQLPADLHGLIAAFWKEQCSPLSA